MNKVKIGICQMLVYNDKQKNLKYASDMIIKAVKQGAEIVVLPEMFNCPYDNRFFHKYAESYPDGETITLLSSLARDNKVYIIGGSIPEKDEDGNVYNTSFIFDNNGLIIGSHRKVHLFDIDVVNGIKFKESDTLKRGNEITVIDTPFCKIGVCICYDIRFPELIRLMALKGAEVVIIPAAFNMTTGPAHWELLFKSRSLDNQTYMIGAAPARNLKASYHSYGNSIVTNPWGSVIGRLDEKEGILIKELDLKVIKEIRNQLPVIKHRRTDLYNINQI